MGRPKGKAGGVKKGKRQAKNENETGEEQQVVPKKKRASKSSGEKTPSVVAGNVGDNSIPIVASESFPMSQSTSGKFIPVFSKKKAKPSVAQVKPVGKKLVEADGKLPTILEDCVQPLETTHALEDLAHPRSETTHASEDLAQSLETTHASKDLARPRSETTHAPEDLAQPLETTPVSEELAQSSETTQALKPLAQPLETTHVSENLAQPLETTKASEDLAQPPETTHASEDLAPPLEATHVLEDLAQPLEMSNVSVDTPETVTDAFEGFKGAAELAAETLDKSESAKRLDIPTTPVLGPAAAEDEDVLLDVILMATEETGYAVKMAGTAPDVGETEDKPETIMVTVSKEVQDLVCKVKSEPEALALDGQEALVVSETLAVPETLIVSETVVVPETPAVVRTQDFNHEAVFGISCKINIKEPGVPDGAQAQETEIAGSIGNVTDNPECLQGNDSVEKPIGDNASIHQSQEERPRRMNLNQAVEVGGEADSVRVVAEVQEKLLRGLSLNSGVAEVQEKLLRGLSLNSGVAEVQEKLLRGVSLNSGVAEVQEKLLRGLSLNSGVAEVQEKLLRGLSLNSGEHSLDETGMEQGNVQAVSRDKLSLSPNMGEKSALDFESSDEEFRNDIVESVLNMMDEETGGYFSGKETDCDTAGLRTEILVGCDGAPRGDDGRDIVDGMDEKVLNTASPQRPPAKILKDRVHELHAGASGDQARCAGKTKETGRHPSEGQHQNIGEANLMEVGGLSSKGVIDKMKSESDGLNDYLVKRGILPRTDTEMCNQERREEMGMTLDEAMEEMDNDLILQEETLPREEAVLRQCVAEMKTITTIEDDLMMGLSDSQLIDFEDQAIEEQKSVPPQRSPPTLNCPIPSRPTTDLAPRRHIQPQKTEGTAKVKQLTKDLSELNMMMVKAQKDMERFVHQHRQACHMAPSGSANTGNWRGSRNIRV